MPYKPTKKELEFIESLELDELYDELGDNILERYHNEEYWQDGLDWEERYLDILERYNTPEYWNEDIIENFIYDKMIENNIKNNDLIGYFVRRIN